MSTKQKDEKHVVYSVKVSPDQAAVLDKICETIGVFQSTLPRGERPSICTLLTYRSVYAAFRDILFMEKIAMRGKRFVKGNSLIIN